MAFRLGEAIVLIKGDITSLNKSMGDAQRAVNKTMGNILAKTADIGKGMTIAGGAIVGVLGMAVKGATEFGTAMAEVNSLGVSDLGKLEEAAKEASIATGGDLVDAAKAMYQVISAGVPEKMAPEFLMEASKAAVAGMTDLTTAVNLGTTMVNTFGLSAPEAFGQAFVAVKLGKTTVEELNGSIGKLAPTFNAAKLGSDEMLSGVAALTLQGLGTSEAVTGLKAAITNILQPSKDAADTAKALGIQFDISAVQSQGLGGFLQMLQEKTGGSIQTMSQLFGSTEALNAIMALTSTGGLAAYNQGMDQMKNATAAGQEAFQRIVDSDPALAWRQLGAEVKVIAVEIGQTLLPMLKSLVDWLRPVIQSVRTWIADNPGLTATIVQVAAVVGGLLVTLGPLLVMLPGIVAAFTAVSAVIGAVGAPILAAVAGIGVLIAAGVALVYNWEAVKEKIGELWMGIVGFFKAGFKMAGELVGQGMAFIYRLLTDPLTTIAGVWQAFVGFLGQAANWIASIVSSVADSIQSVFVWLWDLAKALAAFFGSGMAEGFAGGMGARALGGPVEARTPYIVGERGPELFVPDQSGEIIPANKTAAMMREYTQGGSAAGGSSRQSKVMAGGNSMSVVINMGGVHITREADIDDVARKLAERTERAMRGRGFALHPARA